MADEELKAARRKNLRRWVDDDPIAQGNVSKWCDHYSMFLARDEKPFNPSHIRQYIPQNSKKAHGEIGEDLARKIERATGRPKYSLDEPEQGSSVGESAGRYDRQHEMRDSESRLVARLHQAPESCRIVVEAILGIRPMNELPEGAGDAIRLALKLASSGRREGAERTSDEDAA